MSMDSDIDYKIKPDLIKDTLSLLEFETYENFKERTKEKKTVKKPGHFFTKRCNLNSGNSFNNAALSTNTTSNSVIDSMSSKHQNKPMTTNKHCNLSS